MAGTFKPEDASLQAGVHLPPSIADSHDCSQLKDVDLEHQAHPVAQSDSDLEVVGKQIELEAGNSIKYRTCSWQKVLFIVLFLIVTIIQLFCSFLICFRPLLRRGSADG